MNFKISLNIRISTPKYEVYSLYVSLQVQEQDLRSLMFGDYMNPDAETEERVYEEVKSLDEFYRVVELCLEEYNNTHKTRMNLVIFR